jgi:IclR family transcriptional regulator, pca regulon regulatory protein
MAHRLVKDTSDEKSAAVPLRNAPEHRLAADTAAQVTDSDYVHSLDRGLSVIRAFGEGRLLLTLTDVARETGMTRAAARRFLLTLVKLGYVRQNGRAFALRARVLELGYGYLSGLALQEIAAPHLEQLVERVRESSSISVLDGTDIVYIARVPTKRIMQIAISVGARFPAYATSMGRVLLAGLSLESLECYLSEVRLEAITDSTVTDTDVLRDILIEVREQGYAIVDEELEAGLRSVAAPIRNSSRTVTAAVNVAAHASAVSMAAMRAELLPEVLRTAKRIEADLWRMGNLASSSVDPR